ncbi:MAG: neutral/alkaline non-lysosomal ceramidase N-terminal domain-containing protein, partial [Crenarchaeota archaeon]|nr:neutral/alkaline non-lysosomal ceramidase N-terminal domain-containing protein [Thermoproteota archaeon]
MRAGASKEDITPPVGVKMGGFAARYKGAEGVHDNLYARVLYLEGRGNALLLIANDLLNIPDSLALEVKKELTRRLGIEENGILISATHTHSGPSLPPDITADFSGAGLENYSNILRERILAAAFKSMEQARTAKLGWGVGRVIVGFNRRSFSGPVDPDVNVLLVTDEFGSPIASLVNYACHGVVLGDTNYLISADYPGAVSRIIESRLNASHVALFMNGADGDINPFTSLGYACPGTFEDVDAIGRVVAYAALNTMRFIKTEEEPVIRAVEKKVTLPLAELSEETARRLFENQEKYVSELKARNADQETIMRNKAILSYYEKNLRMIREMPLEKTVETRLQAVRIGSAVLVGIPGEPLVEFGIRVKKSSPLSPTLIVSYANGYCGYIATSEAYDQGGYEVTPTWWNRL